MRDLVSGAETYPLDEGTIGVVRTFRTFHVTVILGLKSEWTSVPHVIKWNIKAAANTFLFSTRVRKLQIQRARTERVLVLEEGL